MIGQQIGKYRLIAELGRGGMGVVYSAEHVDLAKRAAVKQLLPRFTQELVIFAYHAGSAVCKAPASERARAVKAARSALPVPSKSMLTPSKLLPCTAAMTLLIRVAVAEGLLATAWIVSLLKALTVSTTRIPARCAREMRSDRS